MTKDEDRKIARIILALLSKSRLGEIPWETSRRSVGEEYEYSTVDTTVRVSQELDKQFWISIQNADGLTVIRRKVAATSLDESPKYLPELMDLARRKALDVDGTLDRLISELDADGGE